MYDYRPGIWDDEKIWATYRDSKEIAELLGIARGDAVRLPLDWIEGPDGDSWCPRSEVDRLEGLGWQPGDDVEEWEKILGRDVDDEWDQILSHDWERDD